MTPELIVLFSAVSVPSQPPPGVQATSINSSFEESESTYHPYFSNSLFTAVSVPSQPPQGVQATSINSSYEESESIYHPYFSYSLFTAVSVPSQPPQGVQATSINSRSIKVVWSPPPTLHPSWYIAGLQNPIQARQDR